MLRTSKRPCARLGNNFVLILLFLLTLVGLIKSNESNKISTLELFFVPRRNIVEPCDLTFHASPSRTREIDFLETFTRASDQPLFKKRFDKDNQFSETNFAHLCDFIQSVREREGEK